MASLMSRFRLAPVACVVAAVALFAAPAVAATGKQSMGRHPGGLIVATQDGLLQGKRAEGVDQFRSRRDSRTGPRTPAAS